MNSSNNDPRNEIYLKKMSESRRYDATASGDASTIVGKGASFFEAVKCVAQSVLTEEELSEAVYC